jgi:hypothetical protein
MVGVRSSGWIVNLKQRRFEGIGSKNKEGALIDIKA